MAPRTTSGSGQSFTDHKKQEMMALLQRIGPSPDIRDLLAKTAVRDPILARELLAIYRRKTTSGSGHASTVDKKQQMITMLQSIRPTDEIRNLLAETAVRNPFLAGEVRAVWRREAESKPLIGRRSNVTEPATPTSVTAPPKELVQELVSQSHYGMVRSIEMPVQDTTQRCLHFTPLLMNNEIKLGFTGIYNKMSADDQFLGAEAVAEHVRKVASLALTEIEKPKNTWLTKKNGISAILHCILAICHAPFSEVKTLVQLDCDLLGTNLKQAFDNINIYMLARLCNDKTMMRKFLTVWQAADESGLLDKFQIREVKTIIEELAAHPAHVDDIDTLPWLSEDRDQLPAAPWYPLVENKSIVAKVPGRRTNDAGDKAKQLREICGKDHVLAIQIALGYSPNRQMRWSDDKKIVERGDGADKIVWAIGALSKVALKDATATGAHWATVTNAAKTYIDLCQTLAVDEAALWAAQLEVWKEVRELLMEKPVCIDQYLMRLVEYLDPQQRFDLSWTEIDANVTVLRALEELVQRTRKLHVMPELETVRNWLIDVQGLIYDK